MGKEKTYETLLGQLGADAEEFAFDAAYVPNAAKTFVNPWGFVPEKMIPSGKTATGSLSFSVVDRQQWTKEHLILRSDRASVTYRVLALS